MDDIFAQLKSTLLLSVAGFIVYKIGLAIYNFKSYAKIFDACPGETDFHWLYGNMHKFPGPNEAGIQYRIEVMEKRPRFNRVWVGPFRAVLIVYHPELVRTVLKSSGTFIAVEIWCLHHSPTVWDRPHEYLPGRFLGDNAVNMDPFQYVPFSAGPRNCIGQNFAMHELKVMVARIFHRFTLALDPNHEVLRATMATFKAEKDIKLLITPREH